MTLRLALLALVSALCAVGAATAGKAHGGERAALIPALPTPRTPAPTCPIPAAYRPAFLDAAADTRLPLGLLVAVAQVESSFRADARSDRNARGLLQVLPTTAASLRLKANAPRTNVLAGARYLRLLLDRFHSADLALAAYNAGPTAVAAAGGAPTSETLTYVADVTLHWRSLARCNALPG